MTDSVLLKNYLASIFFFFFFFFSFLWNNVKRKSRVNETKEYCYEYSSKILMIQFPIPFVIKSIPKPTCKSFKMTSFTTIHYTINGMSPHTV